jgi:hypothetical protein
MKSHCTEGKKIIILLKKGSIFSHPSSRKHINKTL